MLDGRARALIDPALEAGARRLGRLGVTADAVTLAGFALGAGAAAAIASGWFLTGLLLIGLSRIADGLDGTLARLTGTKSDFGGFLDIVLDFAFYGLVPFGFALADPAANAVPAAALLVAFYANGASFLAFAAVAGRRGLADEQSRGEKSLHYTTGLAEATETIAVFCAMCLLPGWFAALAWSFAALTAVTTVARIVLARRVFR